MRGKPESTALIALLTGITPADAGKTSFALRVSFFCWDHPRGCGENSIATNPPPVSLGSPPRMRGKPRDCPQPCNKTRITPADAGKTGIARRIECRLQDHPRGCGENLSPKPLRLTSTGSPPRMRGKQLVHYLLGNGVKDHPRGCGENPPHAPVRTRIGGSPPRMRGKLSSSSSPAASQRITPADAGKTRSRCCCCRWDHPRGCGENLPMKTPTSAVLGSPPRMRGKPV